MRILMIGVLMFAATASPAFAVCGDVNGDGNRTASDALMVLMSSTGQSLDLVCETAAVESQYSRIRVYGLEGCSSTKYKASTGEVFTASGGQLGDYVEFKHDSIQWVEATACGETIRFDGPFTIPRERKLRVEILLLDPIWLGGTCDDIYFYITLVDEGPRAGGNLLTAGASMGQRADTVE